MLKYNQIDYYLVVIMKIQKDLKTKLSKKSSKEKESDQESMDNIIRLEAKEKLSRLRWSVNVRYLLIMVVALISILCHELEFNFNLGGILIAATIAFIFSVASSLTGPFQFSLAKGIACCINAVPIPCLRCLGLTAT